MFGTLHTCKQRKIWAPALLRLQTQHQTLDLIWAGASTTPVCLNTLMGLCLEGCRFASTTAGCRVARGVNCGSFQGWIHATGSKCSDQTVCGLFGHQCWTPPTKQRADKLQLQKCDMRPCEKEGSELWVSWVTAECDQIWKWEVYTLKVDTDCTHCVFTGSGTAASLPNRSARYPQVDIFGLVLVPDWSEPY